MPINYVNLYSEETCRKNLINFIVNISDSKYLDNKYCYEECYRMYYNLCIQNEKNILNEWISKLIISLQEKNKLIYNINIISDILLYVFSQRIKYNNRVLDKPEFILLCNGINHNIIKKRLYFIHKTQSIVCIDIIKKILLEY